MKLTKLKKKPKNYKNAKKKQVDFEKNVSAPYSVVASLQPIIKFSMHFKKM